MAITPVSSLILLDNDQFVILETIGQPAHGSLDQTPDGQYLYTPTAGFTGNDSFKYVVTDPLGNLYTETANITVGPAGTPLLAVAANQAVPNANLSGIDAPILTTALPALVAAPLLAPTPILPDIAPAQPTVTLSTDANHDHTITQAELGDHVNVSVQIDLPPSILTSYTLRLTDQAGHQINHPLTAAEVTSRKIILTDVFPAPADGQTLTVSATLVNAAGLASSAQSDTAVINIPHASGPPLVEMAEDANHDGVITPAELSGGIDVKVTLPADAKTGDTLQATDQAGRQIVHVITAAEVAAHTVLLTDAFPAPGAGQAIAVSATLTNASGLTSTAGVAQAVMAAPPGAFTLEISEDTNHDGVISTVELGGGVDIKVALPADAKVGDVLKVNDQAGHQITHGLTAAEVAAHAVLLPDAFPAPAQGQTFTVSAALTNSAGLTSASGPVSALIGLPPTPPDAPVIAIAEDANNDGVISPAELSGGVDVKVALPANVKVGDTLRVSDQVGHQVVHVVTAAEIAAHVIALPDAFPAPAPGQTITVSATLANAAGLSGVSSDTAVVTSVAPSAPVLRIAEDLNNDGVISAAELSGGIDLKITLPADAKAGDTLTVRDQAGHSVPHVLTLTEIAAHAVLLPDAFPAPASGQIVIASATLTNAAGVTSVGSTSIVTMGAYTPASTSPSAPVVQITEDANSDGVISPTELSGGIDVKIVLPADVKVGDALRASDQSGRQVAHSVTAAEVAAHAIALPDAFPAPATGQTVAISATLTNGAGLTSLTGSISALMGSSAPAPAPAPTPAPALPVPVITDLLDNVGASQGKLASGAATDDTTPTLQGTSYPGTTVEVFDHGVKIGQAVTGTNWLWSFTPTAALSAGEHIFTVTASNPDGSGATPAPYSAACVVGGAPTPAPALPVPVITDLLDNVGASQGQIANGGGTDDATPTLQGTSYPGTTVEVFDHGVKIGQAVTGANWLWSFTPTAALSAGEHVFTVTASNPDGSGATPAPYSAACVVGGAPTPAPALPVPVITDLLDNVGTSQGKFASGALTDDATPTLQGTSYPGTTVEVFDHGVKIGQAVTGANWSWSFTPTAALSAGEHIFTVVASNPDGSGSTPAPYSAACVVDASASTASTPTVVMTMAAHGGTSPLGNPPLLAGETYWDSMTFSLSGATGTAGATSGLMVGLTHLSSASGQAERLFLANGAQMLPDANGVYWVNPADKVFIPAGAGNNTSADYTLYRPDASGILKPVDTSAAATKHWTLTSPLVLDLNDDGVHTVSESHGVHFDLLGNGHAVDTGWTSPQDGLLAIDLNHNGQIDNGQELFGQVTMLADGSTAQDGFQALAALDSNHDGQITHADALFAKLLVWQDANGDGVTQAGELHTLDQLGVTAFGLARTNANVVDHGNLLGLTGGYTTADGVNHTMADVWFGSSAPASASMAAAGLSTQGDSLDQLLAHAGLIAVQAAVTPTTQTDVASNPMHHTAPVSPVDRLHLASSHDWAH